LLLYEGTLTYKATAHSTWPYYLPVVKHSSWTFSPAMDVREGGGKATNSIAIKLREGPSTGRRNVEFQ